MRGQWTTGCGLLFLEWTQDHVRPRGKQFQVESSGGARTPNKRYRGGEERTLDSQNVIDHSETRSRTDKGIRDAVEGHEASDLDAPSDDDDA